MQTFHYGRDTLGSCPDDFARVGDSDGPEISAILRDARVADSLAVLAGRSAQDHRGRTARELLDEMQDFGIFGPVEMLEAVRNAAAVNSLANQSMRSAMVAYLRDTV